MMRPGLQTRGVIRFAEITDKGKKSALSFQRSWISMGRAKI